MSNYTSFIGGAPVSVQAGDVLQVKEVEHQYAQHVTRTNTSPLDLTDLSITITPQYANSKIFGEIHLPMSQGYGSCIELRRTGPGVTDSTLFSINSTNNTSYKYYFGLAYMSDGASQWTQNTVSWLDTTYNNTQALTYTPRVKSYSSYSVEGYYTHQGNQILHRIYEIKA